jgi:hypothetical protein
MAATEVIDLDATILEWIEDMPNAEPEDIAEAIRENEVLTDEDFEPSCWQMMPVYIAHLREQIAPAEEDEEQEDDTEVDTKVRAKRKSRDKAESEEPEDDGADENEAPRRLIRSGKDAKNGSEEEDKWLLAQFGPPRKRKELKLLTPDDVKEIVAYHKQRAKDSNFAARKWTGVLKVQEEHPDAENIGALPSEAQQRVHELLETLIVL